MFHFQFEEFYTKESSRGQKVPKVHIFEIFVYTYLSRPSIVVSAFFITKICSVPFLRLQRILVVCFFTIPKFVVSAFSNCKSQQCLLCSTSKVSSVRFLTTKVSSVRFSNSKSQQSPILLEDNSLQCPLFRLQKFVVCFSDIKYVLCIGLWRHE